MALWTRGLENVLGPQWVSGPPAEIGPRDNGNREHGLDVTSVLCWELVRPCDLAKRLRQPVNRGIS